MLIWIALLALSAFAEECTDAEIETLFLALEVGPFDNSASCNAAKNTYILSRGDQYSDDFLGEFCGCALPYEIDHILTANLDCTINGQTVEGMMNVCQGVYCDQVGSLDSCTCTGADMLTWAPPDYAELGPYCTGVHDGLAGDPTLSTLNSASCGCITGYSTINAQSPYIGCRYGSDSDWESSIPFSGVFDACSGSAMCRSCFDTDGTNIYDTETNTCVASCSNTVYGCVTAISNCEDVTKKFYAAETCRQCQSILGQWDQSSSQCSASCPSGKTCVDQSGNCPDPCNDGDIDCGAADKCHSPGNGGYCWCGNNGYGSQDCTMARKTVTLNLPTDNNVADVDVVALLTYTSGPLSGWVESYTARSWTFYVVEQGDAYIDLLTQNMVCYFEVNGQNQKLLELSDVSADASYDINCFDSTAYSDLTVSLDDTTASDFHPYVNTELIAAFTSALVTFASYSAESYQINIETNEILDVTDGIQFFYHVTSDIYNVVSNNNDAGQTFAPFLENAMANQAHLAQFWESKTFSLTYTVEGPATDPPSFDNTEMINILAIVTEMSTDEITITTTSAGQDTWTVNAFFSSSDAKIDALIADVTSTDEVFKIEMEAAMSTNDAFKGSTITVGNTMTVDFSITLTPSVDEDVLNDNFVALIPYINEGVTVVCSSLGTQSHQCSAVFTGSVNDLSSAEDTINSAEFQSAFSDALVGTSMNGAVVDWDGSLATDQTWEYSFQLSSVSTMNTTELEEIVATNSGVELNQVSLSMSQTAFQQWTVTATFAGDSNEIMNIQNNIISGSWGINTQAALTASSIFTGTILSDASEQSQVSWTFYLSGLSGTLSDADLDVLKEIIAVTFDVQINEVAITSAEVGGDDVYTIQVLFTVGTSTAQTIILKLSSGAFQVDFENALSGSARYGGATVTYSTMSTLSYVVYMYQQNNPWTEAFLDAAATYYDFERANMGAVVVAISDGYSIEITFTGTNNEITAVMNKIRSTTTDDLVGLTAELVKSSSFQDDGTDVVLEEGKFEPYNACASFYFLFDGQCNVDDTLDIMFVVDSSGSIDDQEFSNMINFLKVVFQNSLPGNTRTSLIQFATTRYLRWGFDDFADLPESLSDQQEYLDQLKVIGGLTYTREAVELAITEFNNRISSEPNRRRVLVVLTDGEPTDGHDPCELSTELNNLQVDGRMVIGVGDDWQDNIDQVTCIASTNSAPYVVALAEYDELADAQAAFNEVACPNGVQSEYVGTYQQSDYLKWNNRFMFDSADSSLEIVYNGVEWYVVNANGASLVSVNGGDGEAPAAIAVWNEISASGASLAQYDAMLVDCREGDTDTPTRNPSAFVTFEPSITPFVEPSKNPTASLPTAQPTTDECLHLIAFRFGSCDQVGDTDIIFMVDGSSSIEAENFLIIKEFMVNQVDILTSYGDSYRFGVMQYGSDNREELGITQYVQRWDDIKAVMNGIVQLEGATYTREAVDFVINPVNDLLATSAATLTFTQPIVILLTDGDPTEGHEICPPWTDADWDSYDAGDKIQDMGGVGVLITLHHEHTQVIDHTKVECFASLSETHAFQDTSYDDLLLFNLSNIAAAACYTGTPFDGKYRKTTEFQNGAAVYEGYGGHLQPKIQLYFQGNSWHFQHVDIGTMTCHDNEVLPYPPDFQAWRYTDTVNQKIEYPFVRILCVDDYTPTATPTNSPSPSPTGHPSTSPTTPPTPAPSPGPSAAPIGMTKPPSTTPDHCPSESPSIAPTVECDCYRVWPGLCESPWGIDFVFAPRADYPTITDENWVAIQDFYIRLVQEGGVVPDPLGDNFYGRGASTLGTVKFTEEPVIEFNNGEWDTRDDWIEFLRTMTPMPEAPGSNLAGAVRTAIYDMFTQPGDPKKDKVMIIVTDTNDFEDDDDPCDLADSLTSRDIVTIVVGVGIQWFKQNPRCLAYSDVHFVDLDSYDDLATLDVWGLMCQDNLVMEGEYQRYYPNKAPDGHYRYVNHWGHKLDFTDEAWSITDGSSTLISRVPHFPYPPDKATWEYDDGTTITTHEYVRLTCCENDIPTREPSVPPTTPPTTSPTSVPTTDEPTSSPSTSPQTMEPTTPPASLEPTTPPSTPPTSIPSPPPTTDEPTTPPTTPPTTDEPTTSPQTSEPTTPPSTPPSTPPTLAPSPDCDCFTVGLCYCDPDHDSPLTCFTSDQIGDTEFGKVITTSNNLVSWVSTPFNGRYCRSGGGELECNTDPRPIYTNGYGWRVYWDCEVWIFEDPWDENGYMVSNGQVEEHPLPWPMNLKTWTSGGLPGDPLNLITHEDVTICCSETYHPTRNPTTDEPTTPPSPSPSTFSPTSPPSTPPTSPPSTSPFTDEPSTPPSTPPTISPSPPPTTDEPSTPPSTSPTTDEPTTSPTTIPSTTPHSNEPTTPPSSPPTSIPSYAPTTDEPTTSPTTVPTDSPETFQPTVPPTMMPTDDCMHFIVGYCPCSNATLLDIALVVDGSNTIIDANIFTLVKQWVVTSLATNWEDGITFGSLQFGTEVDYFLPLEQHSYQEIKDAWDDEQAITGATFMATALDTALEDMWKPKIATETTLTPEDRVRITIFLTDGEPTVSSAVNQDPCLTPNDPALRDAYDDLNITIIPVVLSSTWGHGDYQEHVGCLADMDYWGMYYIDDPNNGQEILSKLWTDINVCRNATMTYTPYNGGYTRSFTLPWINNRPQYVHSEGWISSYSGETWQFTDPHEVIGLMAEVLGSEQLFPQMKPPRDYEVEPIFGSGIYVTLEKVEICCVLTDIPTRSPSPVPTTDEPTSPPSTTPTTDEPTTSPSTIPSSPPSTPPTTDEPSTPPSPPPTTDEPTWSPTTDEPTWSPSPVPTTDEPSWSPTTDEPSTPPSPPPTTDEPTWSPTTDEPTDSPTVPPTTDEPSTMPSTPPTIAPTDDCTDFIVGKCDCVDDEGNPDIWGPHIRCDWEFGREGDAYVYTIYNGGYSRTDYEIDDYPVYIHTNGWEMIHTEEGWKLEDPDEEIDIMIEVRPTYHIIPHTHKEWIVSGNSKIYQNVSICCVKTTIPTHFPTPTPSTPPTTNPTTPPTTDEPTSPPSTSPTTDQPTTPPSTEPSTPPTSPPSFPPTTDSPTTPPTEPPQIKVSEPNYPTQWPTTDEPTWSPTTDEPTSPPSTLPTQPPTVPPTRAPTNDCENIGVGKPYCPCVNYTILDVTVVMDGSESISKDDWQYTMEALADYVELYFPAETARFAFTIFSNQVEIVQTLTLQSGAEHAAVIRSFIDREPAGNTMSQVALEETFEEIWQSTTEDGREKYTVFLTDGNPSHTQDPCLTYNQKYVPNDLTVLPVCIGDVCKDTNKASLECMVSDSYFFPVQYFEGWGRANTMVGSVFGIFMIDCNVGEWETPFNGWYSRMAVAWDWENNEKPRYRDLKRGYEVYWDDEAWTFIDFLERGFLSPMAETRGSTGLYPYTMRNWTQWNGRTSYTWIHVIICCHDNPTPTCNPTVPPTSPPTTPPSTMPTTPPTLPPTTDEPTTPPTTMPTTDEPTTMPSTPPTTDPTVPPTTDEPTTPPSPPPTTDEPTSIPSFSPTTDEPSFSPTTDQPTTPPTTSPSTVPSTPPTPPPTTTQPTPSPITSRPTPPPTTTHPSPSPHTTEPSTPPSSPPTTIPTTDEPSTPPTSPPTTYPTTDEPSTPPSPPPTTDEPTTSPTSPPTTDQPTVTPTLPPTDECVNFHFCYCCTISCGDTIDVLFIVDGSSSISTESFQEFHISLAEGVELFWPTDSESKLGLLQFGSTVEWNNRIPIDWRERTGTDGDSHMERIIAAGATQPAGATMSQKAMEDGLSMWEDNSALTVFNKVALDMTRRQWTFLVTDGKPTGGQDPCSVLNDYREKGIELAMVGLGAASDGFGNVNEQYQCFLSNGYQAVAFDTWEDNRAAINSIFGSINICPNSTIRSPYDGPYSQCDCEKDDRCCDGRGKPIYKHPNGYLLSWHFHEDSADVYDGYWEFRDDSQVLGRMLSLGGSQVHSYPAAFTNWTYLNYSRLSVVSKTRRGYDNIVHNYTCPIYCTTTDTPTRMPSTPPTPVPSPSPSDHPTTPPSFPPTTDEPTTPPTTLPTTIEPTSHPTTDEPTTSPESSEPTTPPTTDPTTDQPTTPPTTSPTTIPSTPPTTDEPTWSPTTDEPTSPPSTSPTTVPTTDEPTTPPSPSPHTSEPTTPPSPSPFTSEPSTPPTAQPTQTPTPFPTPCIKRECDDCPPQLDQALNSCIDHNTNDYIEACYLCEDVVSCDECYDGDIDSINSQLRYLNGDVTRYAECDTLKQATLALLESVSLDIDALHAQMQQDDTDAWQAAFSNYGMDCSYVPTGYCAGMVKDSATACQVCTRTGTCVGVNDECP